MRTLKRIGFIWMILLLFCFFLTGCVPTEQADLSFESKELNFSVTLPAFLDGYLTSEITEQEAYGDTIRTLHLFYTDDAEPVQILSFDEMSLSVWEQVQAEGGPLGVVLGQSNNERVVVLNALQSNPFAEGTKAFEVFQTWPEQSAGIAESFQFLK